MNRFECLYLGRVLPPLATLPHGDINCCQPPPDFDLPAPPPFGWSTGLRATPRLMPRMPRCRERPGLAQNHIFVLRIANLADGRVALRIEFADLTRRQAQLRVTLVARHQRRRAARRTDHLPAMAGRDFNIMNRKADGNGFERQRIPDFGRGRGAAGDGGAHLDANRGDDVTLFAVLVFQQRQARRTHRIVFNRRHRCFHAMLLAFEIHEADFLFMAATEAARGHATIVVATTGFLPRDDQPLFRLRLRNVAKVRDRNVSRGRR